MRQAYDYWQDQPDYYICLGRTLCNSLSLLQIANQSLTLYESLYPEGWAWFKSIMLLSASAEIQLLTELSTQCVEKPLKVIALIAGQNTLKAFTTEYVCSLQNSFIAYHT